MSLLRLLVFLACLFVSAPVWAQGAQMFCQNANGSFVPVSPTNPCPVTTIPAATTWQATMALTAATNTTLIDANVTKAPNSAATPSSFTLVTVINTGLNPTNVCQFGGTCTSGSAYLAPGACDTYNISPASVPSFYSTLGTSLSIRNGGQC